MSGVDFCPKGHRYEQWSSTCAVCVAAEDAEDREQLLTDALSLLCTLEYGSRHLSADGALVPCCPDCDAEKGQAHSGACRVDGVLRRAT